MRAHFEIILATKTESFSCRKFRSRVFTAPFHSHPEYELTAILKGSGRRFVSDSIENFTEGDLVLLGPNVAHRWVSSPSKDTRDSATSLVLHFRHDFLGDRFWDTAELAPMRRMLKRSAQGLHFSPRVSRPVVELLVQLSSTEGFNRLAHLLTILHHLAGANGRRLGSQSHRIEDVVRDTTRIDKVINYVESEYSNEEVSLSRAAKLVALSPSSFSRFFSQTTKRTFIEFVNEVRLSHVCRLLEGSNLPVTDICFACGFGTLSNFHHRFRKAKGATPLAYRIAFRTSPRRVPRRFRPTPKTAESRQTPSGV